MKFFENVFIKMINNTNINCFGNLCYLNISKDLCAKFEFVKYRFKTKIAYDAAYNALRITIVSKTIGVIDSIILRFKDLLNKLDEHIFIREYNYKLEWYDYCPNSNDYMIITNKIQKFIDIFKCN